MFRRTRERFERLERMLEKVGQDLGKLSEEPRRTPASDVAETMAKLFGTMATSQSDLVASLGDIAVRSVARRNGIRGGTSNARTAQRDPNGKFLPKQRVVRARRCAYCGGDHQCNLCDDPMTRNVSIPLVQAHREHEAMRLANGRNANANDTQQDIDATVQPAEANGVIPNAAFNN